MQGRRKIFKYLGWTLAVLLLLVVGTRISLAPLTRWAINDWFAQQGIESRVGDISFNLGDGRFELLDLTAETGGTRVLGLQRAAIGWSWSALSEQQLVLEALEIAGLEFGIEQGEDGRLVIAGIDLSATDAEPAATAEPPSGEPPDWSLALRSLAIEDTRICVRQAPRIDYCSRLAGLDWNGSLIFDLAKIDDPALPLKAAGNFGLSGFEIRSNALERVLLEFESLDLAGIAIDSGDDIGIAEITLKALNLFERAGGKEQGFIEHIDSIGIATSRLERLAILTVAEVTVLGNATDFVKSEAEGYELDEWLEPFTAAEAAAPADSPAAEQAAPATGEAFAFAVGKLVFETEKPLQYRDLSLDKPFVVGISSTRLTVDKLDSRQPEQPSDISYQAKLDGDSLFRIEGTATPLAAKPSFDLTGEIRALDLRRLSPFTAANIGHTIRSGQLDADIKLQAQQAIMNGSIDLVLYHFDLQALSKEDAEAMEASFGFPLSTSLSLLKNREGNIELQVPLSGDLENPDFGTGKIIQKELSKAITSAVLTFYTPFGLITAADALFSLATALKFEPVTFDSGASRIDAKQHGDLDRIAALMQERPGIQLRLCPHSNTADRVALLPDTARIPPEDIRPDDMPALGELGDARIAAIERYLADKQIDPARLVPCASTHAEGEGLSGVEFTI